MLKYNYAYDENGNIINIADVPEEGHLTKVFFCISCGNPMVAAIGPKRRYFRHKADDTNCNKESYLHKLAKFVIKQKFDDFNKPFEIQLVGKCECNQKQQCKMFNEQNCTNTDTHSPIDLHKFYNSCEEEKGVEGFIADLLLTNTDPEKKYASVLIEVKYKHKCTEEKVNSNLKIIEVWVDSEEDIEWFKENTWIQQRWKDFESKTPQIKFFNFEPKIQVKDFCGPKEDGFVPFNFQGTYVKRFVYYQSGKYFIDEVKCIESRKEYNRSSVLELNFPQNTLPLEIAHYLKRVMNIDIKACSLCRYFWQDWMDIRHCNLQSKFDFLQTKDSFAYQCDRYELKWLSSLYKNLPEDQRLKDADVEMIKSL